MMSVTSKAQLQFGLSHCGHRFGGHEVRGDKKFLGVVLAAIQYSNHSVISQARKVYTVYVDLR